MKYLQRLGKLPHKHRALCQKLPTESEKVEPLIMVHGGAGPIFDNQIIPKIESVKKAAQIGFKALLKGGAIVGIVEAMRFLESSGHFNTGKGCSLNEEGEAEMDAIIMNGNLDYGSVCCVRNIENPVTLAHLIMERTASTSLCSLGAMQYAKSQNAERVVPVKLVSERAQKLLRSSKFHNGRDVGAGAIALDQNGNMAASASCGGSIGGMSGVSGDCGIPGASVYADNLIAAVAVTGDGAAIMRTCLAYSIIDHIQDGLSISEAINKGLFMMDMRIQGGGGAIAVSKDGDHGFYFNTKRMPWAYHTLKTLHFGIEKGEHEIEDSKI